MIDQSLSKKTMLQRNQDFGTVFLQGQHIQNEYFSIFFVKEEELCVGFTTKKDYKSKPTRNRMKRILRELWRKNFRKYLLPAHIVIVARMNILKEKHEHLDNLMNAALTEMEKKLNALRLEQEK